MSVSIHWRPTSEKSKHFSGGTSTSLQALKDTFPSGHIGPGDVPILTGMAHACEHSRNFYVEVMNVIEQVGEIEFWGEW